jgi:hypothetical protein
VVKVTARKHDSSNPNYKVVGTLTSPVARGIGVKKGNKPMLDWINAVLPG